MRIVITLISCILFAGSILTSCKKDDDQSGPQQCKVMKAYLYDSVTIYDSAIYTWTGNNITRTQLSGEYTTYEYNSSGQVIKKNIFYSLSGTVADEYWQVSYNTDQTISKIEMYQNNGGGSYLLDTYVNLNYSGGKLVGTNWYEMISGVATLFEEDTYTYTANNITAVSTIFHYGGQSFTLNYTYAFDANSNYFQKQSSQFLFIDPAFNYLDASVFPLFFSTNNVTSVQVQSTTIPVSYVLDANQNLSIFKVNNETITSYVYQCQ